MTCLSPDHQPDLNFRLIAGSYGDIVRGVLSPGIPASPEIDENGLTEVYLVPRIDVCLGTEVDIPQVSKKLKFILNQERDRKYAWSA